ncbi:family 43 glycosylhydrolase [Microbacteriaceae bacterium VKM Ac-2855]|nr:family 43 glycosylhydrolase [Microbacteriaceae bacterium VKM Ac-2855]
MSIKPRSTTSRATATIITTALLSAVLVSAPLSAQGAEPDRVLTPNPAYAGGPFRGWGTSLVWMANATGDYPPELRSELIQKVFGDDGLNLNIARYNVGGGNASDVPDYLRQGGAVPGWWNPAAPLTDAQGPITSNFADRDRFRAAWTGENASDYDFSADSAQLAWVDEIKDEVDTWEAFSNSPPYFMTESGYVSGGFNGNSDQIRTDSLDEFATYLKTVVEHVEDTHGIEFDSIDPLNEPNTDYWSTTLGANGWPYRGGQEGAHAGPGLQSQVLKALDAELAAPDTTTDAVLSGPDETNPSRFVQDWYGWDQATKDVVDQLNVHTYSTGDRNRARDISKASGKPLWMSEVEGNWGGDSWNPDSIENGLGLSSHITGDLRELESEAWVFWQPVEDLYNMEKVEKKNWGSIFVDFDCDANGDSGRRLADGSTDPSCGVQVNSKYNTMRNFTHYIQPGDHLLAVNDSDTTAAADGDGSGATLVYTNSGDSARSIKLDLSRFGEIAPGASVTPIVTTQSPSADRTANALVAGAAVAVDAAAKSATLTVPAKSVTTFVVNGVSGVAEAAPALRDGDTYTITGVQSAKPLAASGSGAVLGTVGSASAATQSWKATLVVDEPGTSRDRFALRLADGRALASNGGSTSFKTLSDAQAASDTTVQWLINTTDGSTFNLLNASREDVLDVADARTQTGSAVGLWGSNGGANQQWTLTERRPLGEYATFRPGQEWLDTSGAVIQAHGGQVVPSTDSQGRAVYYLYGEDRTNGTFSSPGVHVYRSTDLYNWEDRGVALRSLSSRAQFDEPYFRSLYDGYTSVQKDAVYRDLGTVPTPGVTPPIIERPKVIYNKATGKWVMWAHMDGPSATSTAQYAKANAGVAIADSPEGPFRYIDSYRLNYAPEDAVPANRAFGNKGMARDMNLFVDDDGSGYIIYSSEENATMFISKLNAAFTDLATPADRAVQGVDYNRIFVNESRESPAIFKHDDRYFLITSGTTGWNPNPSRWASTTDILGAWTPGGDPFPSWAQGNSWNSQPSSVVPVDRENGEYIYMGDRWNGGDDLRNAQMVWLPITMGEGGDSLAIDVRDEWKLEDLGQNAVWTVTGVPAALTLGQRFDVPSVTVTQNGRIRTEAVQWTQKGSFDTPGIVQLTGTLPGFGGRSFSRTVAVVPDGLRYAVNAGGLRTSDWTAMVDAANRKAPLLNSLPDQALRVDSGTAKTWGYTSEGSLANGSVDGNMFSTLRYAVGGRDLSYRFGGLEPGRYTVYAGYADPWDQWDDRAARVTVNGSVVENEHVYGSADETKAYGNVTVGSDGQITFTLAKTRAPDVQLSWLMVSLDERAAPALTVPVVAGTKCVNKKVVISAQATNANSVAVALTFNSSFGTASSASVAPGKSVSQVFSTRAASVPAGTITVQARATVNGAPVTSTTTAPYPAATCG